MSRSVGKKTFFWTVSALAMNFILWCLMMGCSPVKTVSNPPTPQFRVQEVNMADVVEDTRLATEELERIEIDLGLLLENPNGTQSDALTLDAYTTRIFQANRGIEEIVKQLKGILPEIEEPVLVGFGKNTTGGTGGQTIVVTTASQYRNALQYTSGKRIVDVQSNIDLNGQNVYIKFPDITIQGNGFTVSNAMVESEVGNVFIDNIRFDNNKRIGDAFSIVSFNGKHLENIYLRNVEFVNGLDESLDIRVSGSSGKINNVTVENCKILNTGYGVLINEGTEDITFYHNYFNNSARSIRAQGTKGFNFEFINNYVDNYKNSATNPSQGVRFSAINNYYTTERAVGDSRYYVIMALTGNGSLSNTHAYIFGNISEQGYSYDPLFELEDAPFKSSGIVPMPVNQIDVSKMGVRD